MAFLDRPKEKVNRIFLVMILFIAVWQISNFLENTDIGLTLAKIFLRIDFVSAIFVSYTWLLFVLNFSQTGHTSMKPIFKTPLFFAAFLFALLSFTDLVILNISFDEGAIVFDFGHLWFLYALVVIGFFIAGYIIIILNLIKSHGSAKAQSLYIFLGFSISSIIALVINLFLTNYLTIDQARIGLYGMSVFVFCSFYAIIKHHLFSIKIIATELFILALWIILLIRTFLSENFQDLSTNVVIFVSVVFFGILLVRSVIKEVEQREQIEKLAREIEKAYAVEKKANTELKELDSAKNQFLMMVQHHLRTPLTSMRGYSDLLLGGTFGKVPSKIKEVIEKFDASTESLIKMVNDFLDVTQFQLGKGSVSLKDGINLLQMLEEIIKDQELEAKKKGIYLKFEKSEVSCIIKADESKLKAALVNVFDNCVKYTKEGGVTMRLEINSEKVKIIISDTGIGILEERLSKLFDNIFERTTEAKATFAKGKGIGLYLSGQIIKAHNGRIWAESEGVGRGSTFYIELPIV